MASVNLTVDGCSLTAQLVRPVCIPMLNSPDASQVVNTRFDKVPIIVRTHEKAQFS